MNSLITSERYASSSNQNNIPETINVANIQSRGSTQNNQESITDVMTQSQDKTDNDKSMDYNRSTVEIKDEK